MTVVYADSVFILNALMDYFLLLLTGQLAGIPLRRRRYAAAALLGGGYAVAVFLPGLSFLSAGPVKAACGVLMTLAAFGGERRYVRLTLLFLSIAAAMAGGVLALGILSGGGVPVENGVFYTDVSARILLCAATAAYLLFRVVFHSAAHHGLQGRLLSVRLSVQGKEGELCALRDTGSSLKDPVSGNPVLIASPGAIDAQLDRGLRFLVGADYLNRPAETLQLLARAAPELRPRLLPYRAVGVGRGLLLAIRSDWVEVDGHCWTHCLVGLSPTELGTGYSALWGGEVKGDIYGKTDKKAAETAERSGTDRRDSLHWRQRYSAAAVGEKQGGGTVAAAGCGRRTQGID